MFTNLTKMRFLSTKPPTKGSMTHNHTNFNESVSGIMAGITALFFGTTLYIERKNKHEPMIYQITCLVTGVTSVYSLYHLFKYLKR